MTERVSGVRNESPCHYKRNGNVNCISVRISVTFPFSERFLHKQNMRNVFILLLLLTASIVSLSAQPAKREQELDHYFTKLAENAGFNGAVLVAENGAVVYERAFGFADFDRKKPNQVTTRFPIASISKLLTATAIWQLIEAGKLKEEDGVSRYFPEFPYPAITIRHLLSHTSGLPPYNRYFDSLKNADPARVFTNADFMPVVAAQKKALVYQPGENGNYDNINYIVLALLVEKISGVPYRDYIVKNILVPAGMVQTESIPFAAQFSDLTANNFAFPHNFVPPYATTPVKSGSISYVRSYWNAYRFEGFGEWVSTLHDLLRFAEAYSKEILLKKSTQQKIWKPVLLNNGKPNEEYFGHGWEIEKDSLAGVTVYHSGIATGLGSVLIYNIPKNQVIALYDNTNVYAHVKGSAALNILNGKSMPLPKKDLVREYGDLLIRKGVNVAQQFFNDHKADSSNYSFSENDLNQLGYDLIGDTNPLHIENLPHRIPEAVAALRLNTELFPGSWNAFDSYGEALVKAGKKQEAIRMYRKSLELNPRNEGGKKALEKLEAH
jgi:CubicO group peptidase (beta-lactamase class C family)